MMKRTVFQQSMQDRLWKKPFQQFAIEFDDGRQLVVAHPEKVSYTVGPDAWIFQPDGEILIVDCEEVKQFLDHVASPAN